MRIGIYIGSQLVFAVMLTAVLCLSSVLSPSVANATTYYVATTGNDSRSCATAQTISTPKATIVSGIACLNAGDTLYIRQGVYSSEHLDTTRINIPSGTSWSNPVTIAGYPGETVTMLRGNIAMYGGSATSYVVFNNIIIDCATTECGIYLMAPVNHIRFSNMEVMNSTTSSNGAGMISGNASFLEFLNSKIHNAGAGNCSTYSNQGCYGFYINGHNNLIDGCQIYNNGGYGVHMYHYGSNDVSDNIIRNSTFYGNGFDDARGIKGSGFIVASGGNNIAYNNIVYGNAQGISVAYATTGANNQVYNNTVYGNQLDGISITSAPGTVVKNNIVYGNAGGGITDWDGVGNISNNLTTDPRFVNVSANNFSLQAGSPAIDAGVTVSGVTTDIKGSSRPQGSGYDIGAYEYGKGSTRLPIPSNFRLITVSQ